jgi:hypothetical protein
MLAAGQPDGHLLAQTKGCVVPAVDVDGPDGKICSLRKLRPDQIVAQMQRSRPQIMIGSGCFNRCSRARDPDNPRQPDQRVLVSKCPLKNNVYF